jgi:hypothetical protein
MFLVEKDLPPEDRRQWLSSGWGLTRVKSDSPISLSHFREVSTGGPNALIRQYKKWDEYMDLYIDCAEADVYCHWPLGGAINVPLEKGTVAGVLTRRVEKRYMRTYNPALMSLEFPKLWDATKKFGQEVSGLAPASPNVVWAAFYPEYPSAHRAMAMLLDRDTSSVAISPSLILVGDGKNILIYDKMKYVGDIIAGQVRMTYGDDYVTRRIQKHITTKLEGAP